MQPDADWAAYLRRPFFKEQSIWVIWVYRFGRRVDRKERGPLKRLLMPVYWLLFRMVEAAVGISLPKSTVMGPGPRIWHFGGIFVHGDAVIGASCTLRQGGIIGNRVEGGPVLGIGDDVELGAYAPGAGQRAHRQRPAHRRACPRHRARGGQAGCRSPLAEVNP